MDVLALKPGLRQLCDDELGHPSVSGMTIGVPWSKVNPRPNEFRFSIIDSAIERARRLNKGIVGLQIHTGAGDASPTWLRGEWITCEGHDAPAPWNRSMLQALSALTNRISLFFGKDRFQRVHVTGPTWSHTAFAGAPGLETKHGYSQCAYLSAWKEAFDIWHEAFPQAKLVLAIQPDAIDESMLDEIVRYALTLCVDKLVLELDDFDSRTQDISRLEPYITEGAQLRFALATQLNRLNIRNLLDAAVKYGAESVDVRPADIKYV